MSPQKVSAAELQRSHLRIFVRAPSSSVYCTLVCIVDWNRFARPQTLLMLLIPSLLLLSQVQFSPFLENRIAISTAQNFGIIGNGRQYVCEVPPLPPSSPAPPSFQKCRVRKCATLCVAYLMNLLAKDHDWTRPNWCFDPTFCACFSSPRS